MKYARFLLFLCLCSGACRKDPDPVPTPASPSEIIVSFSPVVAGQGKIVWDSVYYDNHLGDKFTVSLFKYYISNVSLVRSDNSVFTETGSYHLITHFGGKESFSINNVPEGKYTRMRFTIGVDSARNVSGAQTGDLDVGKQMFWDWDNGYIFYKLEGSYNALSATSGDYAFHIGGFSGPYKTLEHVEIDLPEIYVGGGTVARVNLLANAGAIFDSPQPMSFDELSQTPPSEKRDKVQSTNYKDMFTLDNVQVNKK